MRGKGGRMMGPSTGNAATGSFGPFGTVEAAASGLEAAALVLLLILLPPLWRKSVVEMSPKVFTKLSKRGLK
jgi:hypothetical protein